jgi:hypothetical protein
MTRPLRLIPDDFDQLTINAIRQPMDFDDAALDLMDNADLFDLKSFQIKTPVSA